MSYSYYLLHNLALQVGFLGLGTLVPAGRYEGWFFWAVLPVMFAVTLFPTGLLFLAVERPLSLAPGASRERGKGLCPGDRGHVCARDGAIMTGRVVSR